MWVESVMRTAAARKIDLEFFENDVLVLRTTGSEHEVHGTCTMCSVIWVRLEFKIAVLRK